MTDLPTRLVEIEQHHAHTFALPCAVCDLLTALRETQEEGFYGRAAARLVKERDTLQQRVEALEKAIEKVKREIASDPNNRWCRNALEILAALRGRQE